jgi:dihydroxyacetone kinase-like predicted kinase
MGACGIVEGGQTMNPSVEQLLDAIDNAPTDTVVILPNNPNIVLAAEQAAELSTKRVAVVRARSVPQGLAALEAFNDGSPFAKVIGAMQEAIASVRTVEVTTAERDATVDGISINKGSYIGVLDDRIAVTGPDPARVAVDAVDLAGGLDAELLMVFTGAGGESAAEDPIARMLSERFPDADLQVYDGGQPHDRYIIAVE